LFEEGYFELETRFSQQLKTENAASADPHAIENTSVAGIQLPVLNIPTFGGAYEDWLPFHDTFDSLIPATPHFLQFKNFTISSHP
jgi:hypothetical protein